ncbi:MAG: hypothetical protein R3C45_09050 [Phycisphaerales bacterium]
MPIMNRESLQVLTSPMGIIMMVLLLAALGSLFFFGGGPESSGQTYYYDYEAGKVFTADVADLPPIQSPYSGKATGAYIFIYSCDSCGSYDGMTPEEIEAAGGIPAYIAVYSDQARAMFERTGQIRDFQAGRLVKRISDEKWLPSGSYESALASEARGRCGGAKANACQP